MFGAIESRREKSAPTPFPLGGIRHLTDQSFGSLGLEALSAALGAAAGVGLLSSALPWSLELEALRRLPTNVFGVVLALEPVIAALIGSLFLHQHLSVRSWVAIGLVVTASAGAALEITRPRTEPPEA